MSDREEALQGVLAAVRGDETDDEPALVLDLERGEPATATATASYRIAWWRVASAIALVRVATALAWLRLSRASMLVAYAAVRIVSAGFEIEGGP